MNGQLHSKRRWEEGSLAFKGTAEVFLQIADFCKLLAVFPPLALCVCVCACVCVCVCVLSHLWLWQLLPARLLCLFYRILQARILEWVAISSSKESFQPRNQTCISCIGRQILYHWATRKPYAQLKKSPLVAMVCGRGGTQSVTELTGTLISILTYQWPGTPDSMSRTSCYLS